MTLLFAYCCTIILAATTLGICMLTASIHILSSHTARKLMHIITGPLYVSTWLLYPSDTNLYTAYVAATVPLVSAIVFYTLSIYRTSPSSSSLLLKLRLSLLSAVSRTGSADELATGPCYYGILHAMLTVLYWRQSITGIVAICTLCLGDGMAELGGRYASSRDITIRWPYNPKKSIQGSMAFLVCAWIGTIG